MEQSLAPPRLAHFGHIWSPVEHPHFKGMPNDNKQVYPLIILLKQSVSISAFSGRLVRHLLLPSDCPDICVISLFGPKFLWEKKNAGFILCQ